MPTITLLFCHSPFLIWFDFVISVRFYRKTWSVWLNFDRLLNYLTIFLFFTIYNSDRLDNNLIFINHICLYIETNDRLRQTRTKSLFNVYVCTINNLCQIIILFIKQSALHIWLMHFKTARDHSNQVWNHLFDKILFYFWLFAINVKTNISLAVPGEGEKIYFPCKLLSKLIRDSSGVHKG